MQVFKIPTKNFLLSNRFLISFPSLSFVVFTAHTMSTDSWKSKQTIYEFNVKDIDGNVVSMDKYKGHPTLIVNVASKCGLTKSNYKQLNEIYSKFEKDGLQIAAFPCNQFGGKEPGCEVDIKEFIKKNNVHFDMYAKIDVNG